MSSTFHSLRNVNYRYYAAGSLVANIGTWFQRVAQDWLVLQLTGSGTAVGLVIGLQFLPVLLLGPFAGTIADRFPKRRILQCTQAAMAVTAGVLAVLTLGGVVQVWHVYALALLTGVASAIEMPARQTFVVEMVGNDDLPNAIGLNSASFHLARMLGPAMAGVMIAVWGTGWAFVVNAVSYGATIIALACIRKDRLNTPEPPPRKKGMTREGFRYVVKRPDLVLVLTMMFFIGCFGLNFQLTSALMATEVFDKGADGFGLLGSMLAIGSVLGSLMAARQGAPRLRRLVLASVGFGVLMIVIGSLPTYGLYVASLPVLGLVQLIMITSANTTIQLTVAPEMRGRVMALYSMVFIGSTPIGSPFMGWIGDVLGARWTLWLGGALSILGAVLGTWAYSRLRRSPMRELWNGVRGVADDSMTGWKLPTISLPSRPMRRVLPRSHGRASTRRSRRAQVGRSPTS